MEMKLNGIIYAMTGGNGSGKTTYALKISKEKGALFLSLDKTIKEFDQPIQNYEDYMSQFRRALDLMSSKAIPLLKSGGCVVFDFGGGISSRQWLKHIAESSGAEITIFHLEVPLEERKRRIQQRNIDKHQDVYFFQMSNEEFDRHNKQDPPPPPIEEGIKVIRVKNG